MMSGGVPTARTFWSLGLTPAQSWIAEARRSRDLLAGSRILAWLMGQLLAYLKSNRATVRLPEVAEDGLGSLTGRFAEALAAGSAGVSNHASGWVELPLAEAKELFGKLEAEVASRWNELCGEVSTSAQKSAGSLWAVAGPAIGSPPCPLQLVWALKETAASDEEGLSQVEALYAAAKRSRPIPPRTGAPVRKCGQCGKREALGGDDPAQWRQLQSRLEALPEVQRGLRFDLAEYLCSVCGLRRFAGYLWEGNFPSTSAIAAGEWLWRVRSIDDSKVRALTEAAGKVPGYEPQWADCAPLLYRRSVERAGRAAIGDAPAAKAMEAVRNRQRELVKTIRAHNRRYATQASLPESPPEYLAVLMFDGDDLGKKLRQDLAKLPRKVVEFQRRLGDLFDHRSEAEAPLGQPFYLGGDEGLVLAPVGVALELAERIHRLWDETAGATASQPTLSLGIALFDRERPLYAALETARRSLERAKQVPGKQALAVAVQTASGSAWTAVARWGEQWQRLRAAVDLMREDTLASGWPHDVERFLRSVSAEAFRAGHETRAAIRDEVKRLTARRCNEKDRKAVWDGLNGDTWWQEQPADEEIATVGDHLHLVAFLARQAGPGVSALICHPTQDDMHGGVA